MVDLLTDTLNLPKSLVFPPAIVDLASTGQRAPWQLITHGTLCPALTVTNAKNIFCIPCQRTHFPWMTDASYWHFCPRKKPSLNF